MADHAPPTEITFAKLQRWRQAKNLNTARGIVPAKVLPAHPATWVYPY